MGLQVHGHRAPACPSTHRDNGRPEVVHPITDASPLRGFTEETFRASDPELVCLVSGHDETFAQTVHAKISYDSSEIVWGGRFRDIYFGDTERVSINLDRLRPERRDETQTRRRRERSAA